MEFAKGILFAIGIEIVVVVAIILLTACVSVSVGEKADSGADVIVKDLFEVTDEKDLSVLDIDVKRQVSE